MRRIQKSIAECIARAEFVALGPDDSVAAAAAAMTDKGHDCVLVIEGDRLTGIFTERDYLNRVAAQRRDPVATRLSDVMTPDPETLHEDDQVNYAINRMAERSYRNIPVVDRDGKPLSVLDVRLVMAHLIKVFAEVERDDPELAGEWIDIGGGG